MMHSFYDMGINGHDNGDEFDDAIYQCEYCGDFCDGNCEWSHIEEEEETNNG